MSPPCHLPDLGLWCRLLSDGWHLRKKAYPTPTSNLRASQSSLLAGQGSSLEYCHMRFHLGFFFCFFIPIYFEVVKLYYKKCILHYIVFYILYLFIYMYFIFLYYKNVFLCIKKYIHKKRIPTKLAEEGVE